MVVEPELADDDEADEPAEELWQQLAQRESELGHARMILEMRHLQLEHEQGDDDRKHAVAERLDSVQPQSAVREAGQKAHQENRFVFARR